jgi:hypothetical protein
MKYKTSDRIFLPASFVTNVALIGLAAFSRFTREKAGMAAG